MTPRGMCQETDGDRRREVDKSDNQTNDGAPHEAQGGCESQDETDNRDQLLAKQRSVGNEERRSDPYRNGRQEVHVRRCRSRTSPRQKGDLNGTDREEDDQPPGVQAVDHLEDQPRQNGGRDDRSNGGHSDRRGVKEQRGQHPGRNVQPEENPDHRERTQKFKGSFEREPGTGLGKESIADLGFG